jgi:hypothetical protein
MNPSATPENYTTLTDVPPLLLALAFLLLALAFSRKMSLEEASVAWRRTKPSGQV